MGKKYLDTKENTLESSILGVWTEAAKKQEGLDAVNPKAVKKKFDDRKDKDIDNDGDVDDSDEYLHNRRKTVSKAVKSKDEGNAFGMALKAAKDKGEKTFVVAGKTYEVKEEVDEGLEDSPNPANSQHLCAKNVVHEEWGAGQPVHGMHDTPDDDGNIAWYDVMFEHGIEKGVSINELKVTKSESHHHGEKKKDDEDKEMLKAKKEVEESYEIGTDEYRDHTLDVTPGQDDPEWVAARDFKVASMKEALAKVWGLDEKALDKSSKEEYDEEDEELKPVKGSKTMTGGKVAKVDTKPKIG
jgi:hypothetical protein